jgi:CRISPR-associated endonuclease/helicase Cas3
MSQSTQIGSAENSKVNASRPIYAHSLPGRPQSDWETLDVHAERVAALARSFAAAFGAADWGELLGRWHDLGKIQEDFQHYIRGLESSGPAHAWVGALHALHRDRSLLPIAVAIAAHHGSLSNVSGDEANGVPANSTLSFMVTQRRTEFDRLRPQLPASDIVVFPTLPELLQMPGTNLLSVELFTRFLFSTLIDADRLATALFYAQFVPALTSDDARYDSIAVLAARLDSTIDRMTPRGSPAVMKLRREVLDACRAKASDPPGRFSLTVPTGGGKTLSAMSFALNHARNHGLRRVIVVIPYTSIIEQSARIYRDVLNDNTQPDTNNVLEHHSNIDEQSRSEIDSRGENLRNLAAENWSAPVIVTTTVQFFESLLAAHGSRCRKVHNIARSVIVLDEVQTLQPQYLETIVDVLAELTKTYGCTVVLSTATPPALTQREGAKRPGLNNVREIMADPSALAAAAIRVSVEWRIDRPTPYAGIAAELRDYRQALAIVHRRADARLLTQMIGQDVLHLSAAMCPAHRLAVIGDVRHRLTANLPCRLIATQLIEAGVDVDFPIVYRSLAGLDSIAQSAGRCDREGRLTDAAGTPAGRMVVFRAETEPPRGTLLKAFESMQVLIKLRKVDPFEPNDSFIFFEEFYRKIGPDERRVQPLRRSLAFAAVADTFKLIDADMHSIVVPYVNDELSINGPARIAAFRAHASRETARALQPLVVQVRNYQLDALRKAGIVMAADDFGRFDVLCEGREGCYDRMFGLFDGTSVDDLIV